MNEEPVLSVGAAVILVLDALIAVVAYFADIEPEAAVLLGALVTALGGLASAFARSKVTSMAKLRRVDPEAARKVEVA